MLLLRSGGAWRLPRSLAPKVWISDAAGIAEAFERRLGTRTRFLRQLLYGEDEHTGRLRAVVELELVDPGWTPPAHGRWAAREDLDDLPLKDEEQRALLGARLPLFVEEGRVTAALAERFPG